MLRFNRSVIILSLYAGGCAPILINPLCVTPNSKTFQQGKGTSADPYLICSTTQWLNMDDHVDKSFKLGANLDFTGVTYSPIATGTRFSGSLDGGGYTISNISISSASGSLGAFADLSGTVTNLVVKDITVSGTTWIGGLAAMAYGPATISNVVILGGTITGNAGYTGGLLGSAQGAVTLTRVASSATVTGSGLTGGLVGALLGSGGLAPTLTYGSATGPVTSITNDVGGLLGGLDTGASVALSFATGNVTGFDNVGGLIGQTLAGTVQTSYATGNATGANYVGGFVGYYDNTTTTRSYATGSVVANGGGAVGGFIGGFLNGAISHSYARGGTVAATVAANSAAGFIGLAAFAGSVSYCYAAPTAVSAAGGTAGGFIAQEFSGGTIVDETTSFYDGTLAAGGVDGTSKTTAQMKDPATFAGWSTSIWNLSAAAGAGYMDLK